MLETLAAALTAVKNAGPIIYVAVLISTGLVLFLPPSVIAEIGLTDFKVQYRTELGAAFIISASLVFAHGAFALASILSVRRKFWLHNRKAHNYMKTLTADEKKFLRRYVVDGQNSQNASIYDGVANGLEGKGLVYKASSVTIPRVPGMLVPFNMQPDARKWLTRHPQYLK